MNEIKQAIEELNRLSVKQICNIKVNYKILGIAIQALEKQMPKQVNELHTIGGEKYGKCPNCNIKYGDNNKYCSNCGQRLSFEGEVK